MNLKFSNYLHSEESIQRTMVSLKIRNRRMENQMTDTMSIMNFFFLGVGVRRNSCIQYRPLFTLLKACYMSVGLTMVELCK